VYELTNQRINELTKSVFYNFHGYIPMNFRLTTQTIWIIHDPHIFFFLVSRTQVLHSFLYFAHARRAESIPAARVFHRDPAIERDFENRVTVGGFDFRHLAVCLDEADFGHGLEG